MAFIHLTDLHFVPPEEALFGLSPAERLAPAVEMINREHGDAEFLLVTGDLAHRGQPAAYEALARALAPVSLPVHLMLGNHDRRGPFREVFDAPRAPGGYVQFAIEGEEARILCLDTLIDEPDRADGHLCGQRLQWLADEMANTPWDRPWILALHHPPMRLGLPRMDRIMLGGGGTEVADALWEVLAPRPPALILLGHVHRPIHGVWRGIPFHLHRGVNHQVAYKPFETATLYFADEPPEFAIVSMTGGSPLIHTRSYLAEGPVFPKG